MKKILIMALVVFSIILWHSSQLLISGASRERQKIAIRQCVENDLLIMHKSATSYKIKFGGYPRSIDELILFERLKTFLPIKDNYKLNTKAQKIEPLIEYVGNDSRLDNYKILENGAVTRSTFKIYKP